MRNHCMHVKLASCDLWRIVNQSIVNCQHCVIEMLWSFSIVMYLIFNYVTTIHINICVLVPSETQCNYQGGFHDYVDSAI